MVCWEEERELGWEGTSLSSWVRDAPWGKKPVKWILFEAGGWGKRDTEMLKHIQRRAMRIGWKDKSWEEQLSEVELFSLE